MGGRAGGIGRPLDALRAGAVGGRLSYRPRLLFDEFRMTTFGCGTNNFLFLNRACPIFEAANVIDLLVSHVLELLAGER